MSKRKLLLADDSITIQKVVNLTFADEGVEVITVGDGDAAVEKITESAPDLVLADVHMPGLNGYQICEWIRGNSVTKDLPVILLVGSFEPFDETEAARVGANAFLTKPFQSIRQLVSQVTDLMQPQQVSEAGNGYHQVDEEPVAEATASPGEAEVTTAPQGEPDDIDALYHQSFGESASDERDTSSARFVDAGMDDEMIETSFATGGSETAWNAEQPSYGEPTHQNEAEPSQGEAAYEDQPVGDAATGFDTTPVGKFAPADELPGYDEQQQVGQSHNDLETAPEMPDQYGTSFSSSEPASMQDNAGIADQSDSGRDQHSYVDQFAATEQIEVGTGREQTEDFNLDDADLLELPPLDSEKTIEFKTTEELVEEEANKQVVSLSPELMETIIAKVVEKLSKNN